MIKKLTTIGNSLGLIIDRPILDLLRIDRDTPLELRTDGEALIIRPAPEGHETRVRRATERMMERHDETLRTLAE
ncbi:MAG: AbrB/MazE/SpoVT family DNA-binding domain-containing protein [Deltaproteobacteria bacterium]|nr:AbrB/MazE/SpoVT family DNA-binding domain-containing protein [Deltaproteobacteria bacterium]